MADYYPLAVVIFAINLIWAMMPRAANFLKQYVRLKFNLIGWLKGSMKEICTCSR
jgi:hypothetical protein